MQSVRNQYGISIHILFCFPVLGLFASLGFVSNTPRTHHDAQRPLDDFLVSEFWVCFKHSTHTLRWLTPAPQFFVSEFWVCSRVLGLFRTPHAHTTMLNAQSTTFCSRVLGLFRTPHAHTTMLNGQSTIFRYRVLGLFASFSFVLIDLTRCTKKILNFEYLF